MKKFLSFLLLFACYAPLAQGAAASDPYYIDPTYFETGPVQLSAYKAQEVIQVARNKLTYEDIKAIAGAFNALLRQGHFASKRKGTTFIKIVKYFSENPELASSHNLQNEILAIFVTKPARKR